MAESEEELKSLLMNVKEESKNVGLKLKCQSPAPAARESAWRGERCQQRMMSSLTHSTELHVYFKFEVLFYTLTKALGQRFDIFSFLDPDLLYLTCDYIVTHATFLFISYLSKSCLPLAS